MLAPPPTHTDEWRAWRDWLSRELYVWTLDPDRLPSTVTDSTFTASANTPIYLCDDDSTGAITITLPPVRDVRNELHIKKIGNTANVTVHGGGVNIDGAPTAVLTSQYESIMVTNDGKEYFII